MDKCFNFSNVMRRSRNSDRHDELRRQCSIVPAVAGQGLPRQDESELDCFMTGLLSFYRCFMTNSLYLYRCFMTCV